jgi:hypothetical protein
MKVVVAGRVSPVVSELDWAGCEAVEPAAPDDVDGVGVCPLLPPCADATVAHESATTIAITTRFPIRTRLP